MRIYLDYQATTPLDPAVREAMEPYWSDSFGNPHSEHRHGWQAAAGLDKARQDIAALVGADAEWTVFTSGATEANNLALKGVMEAAPAGRRRLVTLATEHSCVLESARALELRGYDLSVLPVQRNGIVDLGLLEETLGDDVALVSIMAVNNEIGVIQPMAEIGALARNCGALVHSDAAQAFGKVALDVQAMSLDLVSISAHKIYGPKGVGGLLVRPGTPVATQMHGGGQEGGGLRSGTLAPALIAGLGKAAQIAAARMDADRAHAENLWQLMLENLPAPHLINGDLERRWHGNLNISFPGVDGARLLADLRRVSVSSGAACASAAGRHSHVLNALGVPRDQAKASLRIGWGRFTTEEETEKAAEMISEAVAAQRRMAA
ncbi:IscS subfamily cysteine desulfurase [Pacificimonas flava]|uniref:Cysteine desulfurase n=2 Tax=Pacificimonas TaxID=1960290 RepID=A0A219B6L8_9SPHN|nr:MULTISPECIES: cysteine desulfurase family protein [Pacificimonas]MBZ6378700.1 cysteine desulfurase [Pacificimonas aurantium]OWV34032.1 IscS subfamily cysteine desulfurase [Pacificimonas flava]